MYYVDKITKLIVLVIGLYLLARFLTIVFNAVN